MCMDQLVLILKDMGLSEKEVLIYLHLLKSDAETALSVAKNTGIDRTSVYDTLNKLILQGIVSSHLEKNTKYFSVISPELLIKKYEQKIAVVKSALPKLIGLTEKKAEETFCQAYFGREGILSVLTELISWKTDYRVIGINREYEKVLQYFNDKGLLLLKDNNVKERGIVDSKAKFKKSKTGDYRYIKDGLKTSSTTIICQRRVIFISWEKPYHAILINNPTIAKAQKEYFSLLWSIAKTNK